ncbi:MotA/TolQ/ExbB proton channel family protein [bacterium]|nr:MotA/TolQ/ExbB proton channel family protein [bacterium]
MIDLWQKGGPVMWPILFVALIGLAFVIERLITLLGKAGLNPLKFMEQVKAAIDKDGLKGGQDLCDSTPQPVSKILAAGLSKVKLGRSFVEESMAAAGAVELAFLDRGMIWIAMSSTLAPILGFLGTVTGMIGAFEAIVRAGEVEPSVVASGISEALITTAAGLAIAAPMVIFHTLFTQMTDRYSRDMEQAATSLVDHLLEKGLLKS